MKMHVYVNYKETCRDAFAYYEKHLGGKIIYSITFGEMPGAGDVGKGREDKIIHRGWR